VPYVFLVIFLRFLISLSFSNRFAAIETFQITLDQSKRSKQIFVWNYIAFLLPTADKFCLSQQPPGT